MKYKEISRLIQVVVDLANLVDEKGEDGTAPYVEELGLGYRALSSILRKGAKGILDLQRDYHDAVEAKNLAETGEKEAQDFLEDIFGDREANTINDEDKKRIRDFVQSIFDEWEGGEP